MPAKKKKPVARTKEGNVLEKIHKCLKDGRYRDTLHSFQRGIERNIRLAQVLEVLETGHHEKSKDEYREDYHDWNYSIRGETILGDQLRVAVYFEDDFLMIATVIRL